MRLPRAVVVIVLLASLLSGLVGSGGGQASRVAAAAPAGQTGDCIVGRELVTNGSFESPGLGGATTNPAYTPDGWSGTVEGRDRSTNVPFADGNVYILNTGALTQTIPTTGLAGAKVLFQFRGAGSLPGVSISNGPIAGTGTTFNGVVQSNTLTFSGTLAPTFTLAIGLASPGNAALDAVSMTIVSCNQAPTFNPASIPNRTGEMNYQMGGATVGFTPQATDPDGDAVTVTCRIPIGTISGSYIFPLGVTTVTCTADDRRGGVATASFTVTVRDTTPPTITGQNITTQTLDPAGKRVVPVVGVGDGGGSATLIGCDKAANSVFPVGVTTVTCTARDSAGNVGSGSFTVTVVLVSSDTVPPVFSSLPTTLTYDTFSPTQAYSFFVQATDDIDGQFIPTCRLGATVITNPSILTQSYAFPVGVNTVNCTATDRAGNSATASFTVTARDRASPSLSTLVNRVVNATSAAGASVTLPATVPDFGDGTVPLACTVAGSPIASTSTFPLGTTTVACSARDAAGNVASKTITVTVRDGGPVVTVTLASRTVAVTSAAGAEVTFTATALDAIDGPVPVTCTAISDIDPGTEFPVTSGTPRQYPLGYTDIYCQATDRAGTIGNGSNYFQVKFLTPPVLSLPANITAGAESAAGATVPFAVSATDAIGSALPVLCYLNFGPGSTLISSPRAFPIGTTMVTCSARDASANRTLGTFTVTVADQAPVLTVPAAITVEATSADGATVEYTATAIDTIDGPITPFCTLASGATFALGTTAVTCTAKDTGFRVATASFDVTVVDTTRPTLTLSPDTTVQPESAAGASVAFTATASDVVDGDVAVTCKAGTGAATTVITSPHRFPLGDTTVTCSAFDRAGNLATGSFIVTVDDTDALTLNVPDDIMKEAISAAGAEVVFEATATDLDGAPVTVTCTPPSGSLFAFGDTTVTCVADDGLGHRAEASFTVTVQDTTAPDITVPADITAEATSADGATVEFTVTAIDPNGDTASLECDRASGGTFGLGGTTVTCIATDAARNEAGRTFTVTVVDTTRPDLSLPTDITVDATASDGALVSYTATATDLVVGTVPVLCAVGQTPIGSPARFPVGLTTVACSATDTAGNQATGTFTVTVVDATDPVLDLPADISTEATGPDGATVEFTVSATDGIDGPLPVSCAIGSGNDATTVTSPFTFPLGLITVTCTATDAAGNTATGTFTVSVVDTTAPTLTVPDDITTEATSADGAVVGYEVTATDSVDGPLTPTCDPASGGTFPLGPTTVACSVTDAAGNTAEASFTVTVVDTTAPDLTVPDPITVEATSADGAAVDYSATATDLVDGALVPDCDPAAGTTFPIGSTTVTCTVTEAAGNSAEATFTVTVTDTTGPTLTVPDDFVTEATSAAGAVVSYTATATDTVDGPLTPTCAPASGGTFGPGETTVTCTVEDAAGNTAQASFTVTVVDTTGPVLTLPEPIVVEAAGPAGTAVTFTATASDIFSGALIPICEPPSGSTFPLGTTTVNCSATDVAGNETGDTFTVTVVDTTAPVVDLTTLPGTGTPRILAVPATGPRTLVSWPAVRADDTVSGRLTVACRIDPDNDPTTLPTGDPISPDGTTFPIGDTLVTCDVVDGAGNRTVTSFTVRVTDDGAPVLTLPASITAEATSPDGATVTFAATASDAVDGALTPDCAPASGARFPIGTTTVRCTATDRAGQTATGSFTVRVVDTTGPSGITWVGGPQNGATYDQATLPAAPTCTATDAAGPVIECLVFGYETTVGRHTLTARARDARGNTTVETRSYTVTASAPTATPKPVSTPKPTATPRPTSTPRPTATPRPVNTPRPRATPTTPAQPTTQPTVAPTQPPRPTAVPTQATQPTPVPTRRPRG